MNGWRSRPGSKQSSRSNSPLARTPEDDAAAKLVPVGSAEKATGSSPLIQQAGAVSGGTERASQWLAVTVREARDLPVGDTGLKSSDPFVVLKLGNNTCRTRVIYRNRYPAWEQKFTMSVDSLPKTSTLAVEVYDKDLWGVEFLAEGSLDLTTVDSIIASGAAQYWVPLKGRNNHSSKPSRQASGSSGSGAGDILLHLEWVAPSQCAQVAKLVSDQCDPQYMCTQFAEKEVIVSVERLTGFLDTGIPPKVVAMPMHLSLKIGSISVEKQITPSLRDDGDIVFPEANAQLKLPLGQAFKRTLAMNPKKDVRDEMQDIKIALKNHRMITIAKTQIPLWDVPVAAPPGSAPAADPSQPPEPPGKLYKRLMENWVPAKDAMELTARAYITAGAPAKAGKAVDDTTEVDDDDDSAEPIKGPPPLANVVCDMVVPVGVGQLYRLMFNADSEVVKKLNDQEKLRDMDVGGWLQDAAGVRMRTVKYIKPLNIPIPFAPKQTEVNEEQKVLTKEAGGFVVETRLTTKAGGDGFFVRIQHVGEFFKPGQAKLVVSVQVEFVKSVMAKAMIESQSISDSKKTWAAFQVAVLDFIGQPAAAGSATGTTTAAASSEPSAAPSLLGGLEGPVRLVCLVLIVLLIILLVLTARSGNQAVVRELAALRQELQAYTASTCTGKST